MKLKNIITINGTKWFDKTYGNTYHTVSIWVDGTHILKSDITYGYGEQYLQTACELLHKAKVNRQVTLITKDYTIFRKAMMDNRDKFIVICNDVNRKKEL